MQGHGDFVVVARVEQQHEGHGVRVGVHHRNDQVVKRTRFEGRPNYVKRGCIYGALGKGGGLFNGGRLHLNTMLWSGLHP